MIDLADIILLLACVFLLVAIGMVAIDLRKFRKDYRAFLVSKSADNLGTAINAMGKRVTRLESAQSGQGNIINKMDDAIVDMDERLEVLETAMIADCEDCDDDEEAADVEAMGATGDIRRTGDDPADVLADPQRFDGSTGLVDVPRVLADRGTEGGTSTPGEMHRKFSNEIDAHVITQTVHNRLEFDKAFDETHRR